MQKLLILCLVTIFTHMTDASTPNIHFLKDDLNLNFPGQIGWMNVKYYENSTLDVTPAEIKHVSTTDECAAACVTTQYNCQSANFKKTENGYQCEVLEKDKFRYPNKIIPQNFTTHLAIQNPCTDEMNCPRDRYKCIPNYSDNTFTCECKNQTLSLEHDCKCPHEGYDFVSNPDNGADIPYCVCKHGLSPSSDCTTSSICPSGASMEVTNIKIGNEPMFQAMCDEGWLTIMERKDGSVPFDLLWNDYKVGFGNIKGEHWLGNDNIHLLSTTFDVQLKVIMETTDGAQYVFTYSNFNVANETEGYKLALSGNACTEPPSKYFCAHSSMKFTTFDADNDIQDDMNCSHKFGHDGGWWYGKCIKIRLTGLYEDQGGHAQQRIHWKDISEDNRITFVRMAISEKTSSR